MNVLRPIVLALTLACTAAAATAGHRHGPPCATDPRCFRASEAVLEAVAGARWVVTIRDAGTMMATEAGSAVRSFVSTLARGGLGGEAGKAAALLARAGETPAEGFASLARREFRVGILDHGAWVAFARLDDRERLELISRWKPSVEADGTLLDRSTGTSLAVRGDWLVLASGRELLPAELPESWGRVRKTRSDQDAAPVAKIEALVRRECGGEPIVALGECEGERFSMRVRLRADDPDPIPGPVPGFEGPAIAMDESSLDRLAEGTILCEISSMRTGSIVEEGPLLATLPEIRMPATFRQNLGSRRVIAVGEVERGSPVAAEAMRCPAVAVACEVEDPEQARDDQDSLVVSAVSGLRRLLESDPETAGVGSACDGIDRERRTVALEAPIERVAGRNPFFSAIELSWGVVDGPASDWQVYATHPRWRDRVSQELGSIPTDPVAGTEGEKSFVSLGRFDGDRLARHLDGWLAERSRFDSMRARFWDEIAVCARLARHVPDLAWKASRRGPAILVELDARLAEP